MRGFGLLILIALTGCGQLPSVDQLDSEGLTQSASSQPNASDSTETRPPDTDPEITPFEDRGVAITTVTPEAVRDDAVRALDNYLAATDEVTRSGGVAVSTIDPVVSDRWLATEYAGFADYQQRGIKTMGTTTHHDLAIQSVRSMSDGRLEVGVFACIDASSVWVVPAQSPEPPDGLEAWLEAGSPPDVPTEDQVESWQAYLDDVEPDAGFIDPVLVWLVGTHAGDLVVDATETWRGYHPCQSEQSPQQDSLDQSSSAP